MNQNNALQTIPEYKTIVVPEVHFDNAFVEQMKKDYGLDKAKPTQFASFIATCKMYGLDPRLNQVYAWIHKDRMAIAIGINGWLDIANRQPSYAGIEHSVVYEGDTFKSLPGNKYEFEQGKDHGVTKGHGKPDKGLINIKGAFCLLHRKDRQVPTLFYASFNEFFQPYSESWKHTLGG